MPLSLTHIFNGTQTTDVVMYLLSYMLQEGTMWYMYMVLM